jgi:hypothetical protein
MVEIYLVNSSKKEYVFLAEGYNVAISWVFRYCWDTTDNVYILNMNECGLMLSNGDEGDYSIIELKNGYIVKYLSLIHI